MIDKKWIGHELGASELVLDRARLRFFAEAIGEDDPIYTDVDAARAAGYADLPAPPTFLFAAELDSSTVFQMLETLGVPLDHILHGEQSFTYHQPACAGDTVTVKARIEDLYDKKNGAMEFIVKASQAHNQRGELVVEMRSVIVYRH
ncbi:MAG: MaoC family dehydratase [Nevskiaceae bacterium]|nr:MAG: MaoC family dehydratase [Nevskiaceae bacterium]TBR74602.1 MAG: MaoC family dehydratase [Nevskiaceae bacterium]